MTKCIKTDLYRMVTSWQFYIGIAGVACLYFFAGRQAGIVQDVYSAYFYNRMYSSITLAYAFCAVSFSSCLIEDSEHQIWYLIVQKKGLNSYINAKIFTCFLSGVLTMVLGVLLFVGLMSIRMPLLAEEVSVVRHTRMNDVFGFFLQKDTILLFFTLSSAMHGMLGGVFSVLSACLSLYEKNRIFTIITPVIGFYFLKNFMTSTLHLPESFDVHIIFESSNKIFQNSWANILYAVVTAIFLFYW